MPKEYHIIEERIRQALDSIPDGVIPNIAALARKFDVPGHRLSARYHDRGSRSSRDLTNMRLSKDQELALCRYIDTFEKVEIFPRQDMVLNAARSILRESNPTAPPLGDKWLQRSYANPGLNQLNTT